MVPLLPIMAGVSGALGVGQGIANVVANDDAQRMNKQRLAALQASGGKLSAAEERGITGAFDQARQAQASMQQQAARMQAASGGGGAEASRLREEALRATGDMELQNARTLVAAQQAKKEATDAEIEARTQAKTQYKMDDINSIFGALSQGAAAVGMGAGSQGVHQMSNAFGSRFNDAEKKQMRAWAVENPDKWAELMLKAISQ